LESHKFESIYNLTVQGLTVHLRPVMN